MKQQRRIVLITGPSGAGRTTAIRVLEDLGFEAIDNLPMGLLMRLLDGSENDRPMALGIRLRPKQVLKPVYCRKKSCWPRSEKLRTF